MHLFITSISLLRLRLFFFLLSSYLLLFSSPSSPLVFAADGSNNNNSSKEELPSSTQKHCVYDHFSALLHLKQGFNFSYVVYGPTLYPSKTTLSSWNPDNRDCCSWEGIICDGSTGHVTRLDLSFLHISGQIDSQSLSRLWSLQRLDLSFNRFEKTTSIGSLVKNLTSLRELHLDRVNISAEGREWGESLSSLHHLRKLSLSRCGLPGPIHSSLSQLHYLTELDLSDNDLSSVVPDFIGNFSSLTFLSLSYCGLHGRFPNTVFKLPSLKTLDVSSNPSIRLSEFPQNSSLQQLDLSINVVSGKLLDSLNNLKFLTVLVLRGCNLVGPLPLLANLTRLEYLALSNNSFNGPIPSSLFSFPSLLDLDLSRNQLGGQLGEVHNASHSQLERIDLSENNLMGMIPRSIFELKKLQDMSFAFNNFSGDVDLGLLMNFKNLYYLDLSDNSLSVKDISGTSSSIRFPMLNSVKLRSCNISEFPSFLRNQESLQSIDLSNNKISGDVDLGLLINLKNLTDLDLSYNSYLSVKDNSGNSTSISLPQLSTVFLRSCNISEFPSFLRNQESLQWIALSNNKISEFPSFLRNQLESLQWLDLSNNKISGDVDLGLLINLKNLTDLDLSNNSYLSVKDNSSNSTLISLPQLSEAFLRSCNISEFPSFLRNQESLQWIDLSNNRISGEIPQWIWKVGNGSLRYLNLSHNLLHGIEPPIPLTNVYILDLSCNMIKGSFPISLTAINFFSLSNNSFTGEIPASICNATSLGILDLSDNHLNGRIPPCLGEMSGLTVLNLRGNDFHGTLLQTFKEGCYLETIDFSRNQLVGKIPRSLSNCKRMEVLDLGNNHLHDTFPSWLGELSKLRVLVLRSNQFHGPIGYLLRNNTLPLLQIIDLSSNNFTGSLPSNIFRSWKAMTEEDDSQYMVLNKSKEAYYQDKVTIVSKGLEMELVKILTAFTVVDFSNNEFQGNIPESIGDLKSLLVLNMSHNHFKGQIPTSFENIRALESLDLSHNKLSGKIPPQLTVLTFLEVLDISQNLLVGSIPQSQQFLTFPKESFVGNLGLCGPPLPNKCEDGVASLPLAPSESTYDWEFTWIGFGVGYGVGLGILLWTCRHRQKAEGLFLVK